MARNGSGVYSLPAGNPVTTGTTISSTWANNTLSDIATALTASIAKDGQTSPTANLPMGSFILTGLGAGTADGHSLRYEQLFSQGAPTDIASAATTDIGAVRTNFLTVTGTTGITSLGTNYNGPKMLRFAGALTLTHNATTLVLPGAANLTTVAGDTCVAIPKSTASGTADGWNIVLYSRSAGYAASGTNIDITSLGNNTSTVYTTAGTSTAYTITPTPAISAYAIGQSFVVNFNAACGASPTLQISGIATPPNLVKENPDGTFSNLAASDVPINHRSRVTLISTTQALVERTSAGIIASGAAPVFGARAFCTWNGATTGTYSPTLPSGNISSIVRTSTGLYTLNFSTAMADAEYSVVFGGDGISILGSANSAYPMCGVTSKTASAVTVQFFAYAGSTNTPAAYDPTRAHIAIFR